MIQKVRVVGCAPRGIFLQDSEGKFLNAYGRWQRCQRPAINLYLKVFLSWREARRYAREQGWQVNPLILDIPAYFIHNLNSYLEWTVRTKIGQGWIYLQLLLFFAIRAIAGEIAWPYLILVVWAFQACAGCAWHFWLKGLKP